MFLERGVSKRELFDDYYMVELPSLVERMRRKEARDTLNTLTVRGLPHWKDDRERERYLRDLRIQAGYETPEESQEAKWSQLDQLKAKYGRPKTE